MGSENGVDFLVMEYLEGETLQERLKKGALPLDQALEYGSQIADGLDKAHRAGIVHQRDLKPPNVILTKSGAKLLDFGLAKFAEAYSELGKSATILSAAAAHHRFLWIHPFLDGNGRVACLMTHATFLETLDTGAIWSIARGLARHHDDYKLYLAKCDLSRRNDLDGRTRSGRVLKAVLYRGQLPRRDVPRIL